jgi:hypothetical protein
VFVFLYTYFYKLLPVSLPSNCEGLPIQFCKSRGLVRGFHAILNGNFHAAFFFNEFTFRIFSFFVVQLILRLFFIFLNSNKKAFIISDAISSGSYFIFTFYVLLPFV